MELLERIVKIREQKGMTQTDVAEYLNTDRQNYSRLEKRGDKLSLEQVKAIATALGVSLNELLGLDAPVVNQDKVKELEKRIEELESRIKDKDDRLLKWSIKEDELLMGLCTDIIVHFKTTKDMPDVNPLYELIEEEPFCKLKDDEETKRRVKLFLKVDFAGLNLFGSVLYRRAINLLHFDRIIAYLNEYFVIEENATYISSHVDEGFKKLHRAFWAEHQAEEKLRNSE